MKINEATLTARLHQVLENVFPSFSSLEIKHQGSFSFKFGHHNVKVDLKDPSNYSNRAIYDILLTHKGMNLILVELKREGLAISEEDIHQGLSYARLIPKMPPIVLISNGVDNHFYDSYTMEKCKIQTIDLKFIQERVQNSFTLATSDLKNAINFLLNKNPKLIGKVISKISGDRFRILIGAVNEIDKPICPEFQVKRNVVDRIYKTVLSGNHIVGLIGPAFSGKTCALYQFFREYGFRRDHYVLYLNLKDYNFSIFQQLAQEFSRETKDHINKDKIRDWFNSMLYISSETRFILLVDNLNKDIPEEITNELLEMISLFRNSNHSIIYTVDEWAYKQFAYENNRNYKTIIGAFTKVFTINDLTKREFRKVNGWLYKNCRMIIPNGGHFCEEYRMVRILRMMAGLSYDKNIPDGVAGRFSSITDLKFIEKIAQNPIFTKEIHEIYKTLCAAFFLDKPLREKIPELSIIAKTLGAFTVQNVKSHLGIESYNKIIKSGLVVEREYMRGLSVFIPKIPELIIYHSIDLLKIYLSDKKDKDLTALYKDFISYCQDYPSPDLIGAGLLRKIGEKNVDIFTQLVLHCLNDVPETERISKGTKVLTFLKGYGYITIRFDSDMENENFIYSHLPHSILAQLVDQPMLAEDQNGTKSYDYFIDLLYELCSAPQFLCRLGSGTSNSFEGIITKEFPEIGILLSEKNGVVETIVQSIQKCFFLKPDLIQNLCERAIASKNYYVLWRIYLAMHSLLGLYNITLELKARKLEFTAKLEFFKLLDNALGMSVTEDLAKDKPF